MRFGCVNIPHREDYKGATIRIPAEGGLKLFENKYFCGKRVK